MLVGLIAGGIVVGDFIYHRWFDTPDKPPPQPVPTPETNEGSVVPLVYGKVKLNKPILAWFESPQTFVPVGGIHDGQTIYSANMFWVLGIPFSTDDRLDRINNIWAGDLKLQPQFPPVTDGGPSFVTLPDLDGDGNFEDTNRHRCEVKGVTSIDANIFVGGWVEFLNGKSTQLIVDPASSYAPTTKAGDFMTTVLGTPPNNFQGDVDKTLCPGYRGYLSCLFYNDSYTSFSPNNNHWVFGLTPQVQTYSFEVSSYVYSFDASAWPAVWPYSRVGDDSNPANVIFDLLTGDGADGKLGQDPSTIDITSFRDAAHTLFTEGHGYSRALDQAKPARDHINDILKQIDGALSFDVATGQWVLKLVRNDYNLADCPEITRANCKGLRGFASGGWLDRPNRILIEWTDRANDYIVATAPSSNQALSTATLDGGIREQTVQMLGICDPTLAHNCAERELAATSRPLMKLTALMDRSALRWKIGDVVKLTWSKPDIAGLPFRVANINRGALDDGTIAVDLIQDFYFTWRDLPPENPGFGGHTIDGLEGLSLGGG
jgi:hypothetical protein